MQMDFELCKLAREDVALTRSLYEEVFCEDSNVFVDYYYEVKAPSCVAFVWKNRQGEIVSMLHLDSYTLCVKTDQGEEQVPAYYVICVATKDAYRHQGCMAGLLQAAEMYCGQMHVPFLFLMPADAKIYEPFGYHYLYERKEYYVNYYEGEFCRDKEKKKPKNVDVFMAYVKNGEICYRNMFEENVELCKQSNQKEHSRPDQTFADGNILSGLELCKLKDFANQWLQKETDYYLHRSEMYYVNLLKELAAQNGCIYMFLIDGEIEGYYAQTKEEESNMGCGRDGIQEAMLSQRLIAAFKEVGLESPILSSDHTTPIIMGKCLGEEGERLRAFLFGNKKGFITELL